MFFGGIMKKSTLKRKEREGIKAGTPYLKPQLSGEKKSGGHPLDACFTGNDLSGGKCYPGSADPPPPGDT